MLITLGRGMAPTSSSNATYTPPVIDYYVILLAGQSNMASRGTPINPAIDTANPRIFQLERTVATGADISGENIILAQDPLDHIGATENSVGMGMSFAKQLLTLIPASSNILLVPCAEGSTGFNGDDWNIGDPNYEDTISRANHAMSLGNNRFSGILWHQGEQEGQTLDTIHTPRLDTLIATMRNRITGANATTPFIVGDLKDDGSTPIFIRKSLNEIKARVPYSGFANSTGLTFMPDDIHFDPASQREFGTTRYWNEYNGGLSGDLGMSAPAPATITATNDEDNQTTLNVSAGSLGGSSIRHIAVFYKLSSETQWNEFHRKADSSLSITVTGLTNNNTYDFKVSIITSAGVSADSNSVSATPNIALSTPVNTSLPVISGTEIEGETLSVTDGTWTGNPIPSYSYQWQRSNVDILGATTNTYVLTIDDVGETMSCIITATNSEGLSNAQSNATGNISAASSGGGARAAANSVVSGAVIDLSARNSNSFDPAVDTQTWDNLGSGPDFWLGDDGTSEVNEDPNFIGTAGDSAAYFRLGNPQGKHFKAKNSNILLNNLHRSDSTTPFTFITYINPRSAFRTIFATTQHSGGNGGVIFWTTGNTLRLRIYNETGGTVLSWNMNTTFSLTQNSLLAFTYDPVTTNYTFKVNDEALETGTQSWTNTAVIDELPTIMSDTSGSHGWDSTDTQIHDVIFYDKALTETEINDLFTMLSTSKI